MKKFITILLSWCLFASLIGVAQDLNKTVKEKSKYKYPDTPVENLGFWMEMAQEGIVNVNPSFPVKPADYIGSRVKGDPIDQMSTDVCVWNETGVTQSENSVFIDPDNAEYILNSNNSEQSGSIYGANYIISSNAAQAWSGTKQGAGGANSGDPATAIGRNGRHYVGYITNAGGQGIAWSSDGATWNPVGIATSTDLLDKNHLTIDNRTSGSYINYLYSAWTRFESGHANDNDIEFSRSTNSGAMWSSPINISNAIVAGNHNQGVNVQTGPSGQVYAVWAVYDTWGPTNYYENALGFAKSTNGGASFGAATRIHNNIKGIRAKPSTATTNVTGKNMRVFSFPSMAVDVSGGAYNGYIYVVWPNVGTPGTNTGTNVSVYCMRSTDGGTTWNTPVRVNQGTTAADYASYFPWITCDPVTGKLFCIFYDDRNLGSTSTACEVWCAYSEDGGATWSDFRVGDVSFTPAPIPGLAFGYMGDYLGISARDGWVYPCWTDNRSGRALTYVSPLQFGDYCVATGGCDEYISNVQIGTINNSSACEGYMNYTNLSTNIPVNSSASLSVTNGITSYPTDQCGVWVDWNNDGVFSAGNETITVAGTPGVGPYTATIDPPDGTTQGAKTMRIRITYTGSVLPCGSTTYGEVEDYTINVSAPATNVWDGSFNYYWHNANNWSLNHIPTADEPVEIPNVGYQPVAIDFYDEACTELNLLAGATLNIYDQVLTVNGSLAVYGNVGMLQDNANINVMAHVNWYSGSSLNVTAYNSFINVYGDWGFQAGSNINPTLGFVDFEGATSNWIRSLSSTSSFYNLRIYKTGGAVAKVSNLCTHDLVINNLTFINSPAIFQSLSDYNIVMKGDFNYYGTFDFTQSENTGSVVFDGTSQTINNYSSGSGIFNNVVFSASSSASVASGNLSIAKNVTINQGNFNSGSVNITLGGNWNNTVGASGYTPGTGTVTYHSAGSAQDVNGTNTFNNIIQDNTGQYLRFNGNTTILSNLELHNFCWAYQILNVNGVLSIDDVASKFTANGPNGNATIGTLNQGGKLVSNGGGIITVNDLVENGLFGSYYVYSASDFMQITNSGTGTYVDLAADLHILGGTMEINGTISWWPYGGNAEIEMTDGVLDLTGCGIYISNNLSLIHNITGGTIRTIGGFSGNRADFTPTAGTIEFYGSSDAVISQSNGCTLYNVNIDKSAKDGSLNKPEFKGSNERKDETWGEGGKANNISLSTDFTITNELSINSGSLTLNGHTLNVAHDCIVYGTLNMNNAADLLNAGTVEYDQLWFYSGSVGNISAGNMNLAWGILVYNGASFTASTANTIHYNSSIFRSGIANGDPNTVFGNIEVIKPAGYFQVWSETTHPVVVNGNFILSAGNSLETQDYPLVVHGTFSETATSSVYVYDHYSKGTESGESNNNGDNNSLSDIQGLNENGAKGGSLTIDTDFTLNGLMDVADGNVLLHGGLTIANTGILTITSGSFIADKPYYASDAWQYINGTLNLTSGLFEITHNSMRFTSTASTNITGGTVRCGFTFYAVDPGVYDPFGGVTEFTGSDPLSYIYCYNGNWFNDFTISKGSMIELWSDITVKGNVNIVSGPLNTMDNIGNQFNMYVAGHWNNTGGEVAFNEGTGTVFFNGTGLLNHQNINGTETFFNIENAKSGGGHLKPNGITTINNNYLANGVNIVTGTLLDVQNTLDLSTGELGLSTSAPNVGVNNFTMGGVLSVTDGNFTCTDVTNNGIFGNITLTNGSITLFQDAGQYPDLNATVTINGGYMAINGGSSGSFFGYGAPCNLTMTNGELDFNGNGIYMDNTKPVSESITGGTIKTDGMFGCANTNFTPAGGTIQLYGGSDAYIQTLNNSNVFNLLINKSGGDKTFSIDNFSFDENKSDLKSSQNELASSNNSDRPKFPAELSKSNTIYTTGALRVNGTTTVEEGTLMVDNFTTTCMNNIIINSGGKLGLGDYGTLAIENGKSLTINNGGLLDLTGTVGGAATITRNTGNYALNVESGGTIGGVYGVFEYMNTNGVNVKTGALVDNLKPFNNCTFRNGQAAGTLLKVENSQTFYVENAVFPTNAGAGSFNVTKAINAGMVYFVTATGVFAGESFDNDPNSRIMWTNRSLSLKAFLEGPFNGATMNTTLNSILPLNHPFNPALPYFGNPMPDWRYTGAGSVAAIPNVNIVDWVLVDLRDAVSAAAATPATSVAKFPAFILNNGNIVGLNGSSNLDFTNVITNNLFVVIYNRNHQSIINASPVPYTAGVYTYDYTTGAAQVYGGIAGHKQLATGKWGMRSGDGNGDCDVLTNDKTQVWGISGQIGKTGYLPSDYNFDRQTNNKDKNDKWVPNLGTGSQVPN